MNTYDLSGILGASQRYPDVGAFVCQSRWARFSHDGGTLQPLNIPQSQLYYWSRQWQADEQASLAELHRGEARRFDNADDAIGWLFSEDD